MNLIHSVNGITQKIFSSAAKIMKRILFIKYSIHWVSSASVNRVKICHNSEAHMEECQSVKVHSMKIGIHSYKVESHDKINIFAHYTAAL